MRMVSESAACAVHVRAAPGRGERRAGPSAGSSPAAVVARSLRLSREEEGLGFVLSPAGRANSSEGFSPAAAPAAEPSDTALPQQTDARLKGEHRQRPEEKTHARPKPRPPGRFPRAALWGFPGHGARSLVASGPASA